jgi:class 3 adenylate cyclase
MSGLPQDAGVPRRDPGEWRTGDEGVLETAVLFVDLVSSCEFASVMGLREYAGYVESFQHVCVEQTRHLFGTVLGPRFQPGTHFEYETIGDELAVFLHSGNPANDVYQLLCLAIAIKCGWLGMPQNRARMERGLAAAELAAGIHLGQVWARKTDAGFHKRGFAVNAAKRTETASRDGTRFRIYVTDSAVKVVGDRLRHVLFSPRRLDTLKGLLVPMGIHEVVDSFADLSKRLAPDFAEGFEQVARSALATNTFDLWIHSCLQVWEEAKAREVTDGNFALCRRVLKLDAQNAVALYYAAQAMRERGDADTARLYLADLTQSWPGFGDGWLELGKLHLTAGNTASARDCMLQARRHGVPATEALLPGE